MEMLTNAIAWVEIPVVDFERARIFYSRIFDYEMPVMQMGPTLMGFLLHDRNSGIGGAIVQGEDYIPSHTGPLVYLNGGSNLLTVLDRVDDAGGAVLVGKTHIGPELGYFAIFQDCEGNKLALHSMG